MAIQDRKMDGKTKIAKIKANIDDVMKSSEKSWQNNVTGWLFKTQRKIAAKEADDKIRSDNQNERKRRLRK